jgi:hexokinase
MDLEPKMEGGDKQDIIRLDVGGTHYKVRLLHFGHLHFHICMSAKYVFYAMYDRQVSRKVLSKYPDTMLGALAAASDTTAAEIFIDRSASPQCHDEFFKAA